MFGKFFDTTGIAAFSDQMVREMVRALPPAALADASAKAAKRRDRFDERVRQEVERFSRATALNVFQKAKLGPSLQNAMEAAGYPAGFSKDISFEVVKLLAQAAARRAG